MPTAQWIWLAGASDENAWVRFRRTATVDTLPDSAVLRIAVDSKYWLWVNGQLIVREGGLKRGPTPTGTYADKVDIRGNLTVGENVIAVLAWYWGVGGASHRSSGRGGLWVESPLVGSDAG